MGYANHCRLAPTDSQRAPVDENALAVFEDASNKVCEDQTPS